MTGAFAGERAVVVGFGTSGRAAASLLLDEGAEVRVSEQRPLAELELGPHDPAARSSTDVGGVDLRAGGHLPQHLDGATLVVVSPGVRPDSEVITWARRRKLPVWSELELGARLCTVPVIAITGTNGKTTTSLLVAAAMSEAGLAARACGNVGYPFSSAVRERFDALAVEVSSFQLAFSTSLRPRVSILLNLAPDHLDWHGSFRAYAGAKARIYAMQGPGDTHVGNRHDREAARVSAAAPCDVQWFCPSVPRKGEVGVAGGHIVARLETEHDLGRPPLDGRPIEANSAAAAAASLAFGLPPEAISRAISGFTPLPHRGELVARVGSVRFFDDSKATNPHAALAALEGKAGAVLVAGGLAKGVDLEPLAAAAPSLAAVVVLGEAAGAIARVFDRLVPVHHARSMDEAVDVALRAAPPGGSVVLAPACASQDMFRDYAQRGERFAAAARSLAAAAPTVRGTSLPSKRGAHA